MDKYMPESSDVEGDSSPTHLLISECLHFADVIIGMDNGEELMSLLTFPLLRVLTFLQFVDGDAENLISSDPNLFAASDRSSCPDEEIVSLRGKYV